MGYILLIYPIGAAVTLTLGVRKVTNDYGSYGIDDAFFALFIALIWPIVLFPAILAFVVNKWVL